MKTKKTNESIFHLTEFQTRLTLGAASALAYAVTIVRMLCGGPSIDIDIGWNDNSATVFANVAYVEACFMYHSASPDKCWAT